MRLALLVGIDIDIDTHIDIENGHIFSNGNVAWREDHRYCMTLKRGNLLFLVAKNQFR